MKILQAGSGVAAMALAGALSSVAHGIVIDSFSSVDSDRTPWPVIQFAIGAVNVVEADLLGVLGGIRDTTLTLESVTAPGVDFMQTAIVPGAGFIMDYAASAGANGATRLVYNGGGSLSADFSLEESIVMEFAAFDFALGNPLPVLVTLSDGTNSATLTHSLTAGGPGTLTFTLADFSGIGAVNLAAITSVSFNLDPGVAADYRLTSITTVPIPGPGALALLGVAGLTTIRRRR